MSTRPKLEVWGWIAGIGSLLLAVVAYIWPRVPQEDAKPPAREQDRVTQSQFGSSGPQINNPTGPVIFNPPPAPRPRTVEESQADAQAMRLSAQTLRDIVERGLPAVAPKNWEVAEANFNSGTDLYAKRDFEGAYARFKEAMKQYQDLQFEVTTRAK